MENEAQTLQLVKDVADVLESVAANKHHTPALYSTFLRALLSARLEAQSSKQEMAASPTQLNNNMVPTSFLGLMPGNPTLGSDFHFDGEMGPVADMSTFPPTMAAHSTDDAMGMLSVDSIFSNGFWDNVLVPGSCRAFLSYFECLTKLCFCSAGYSSTMEGLSGGFVFGAGGSGLITPRFGTPMSRSTTPIRGMAPSIEQNINVAFTHSPQVMGIKLDA